MNKNTKQKIVSAIILIIMTVVFPLNSIGYSDRTDFNGGHKNNKNASGLGLFHYHCGGNLAHLHDGGVCPYFSVAQSTTITSENVEQPTTRAQIATSTKE